MRKSIVISLVALAATSTLGLRAEAAGRDPLVIQGIGPEESPAGQRNGVRGHSMPAIHDRGQRRVRIANSGTRGQYGGGFIEFLMTGNSDPVAAAPVRRIESPYYNRRPLSVAPHRERRPAYRREASVEPEPSFRRRLPRVVDSKYNRQEVAYSSKHGRGTIVVDTPNRFLYYVLGDGRAMRYGIGVGRPGFEWSGVKKITRKAEWPNWRPPPEMRKRRPDLPSFMEGGPSNPLGARALYLGSSLYRIHGTNEPNTIGTNVSSGCIRLMNKDVIDLYQRTRVGAKVIVI
jgi:lipoprotein-anchoring transpeptidase ErfK/SrfK